jgi:hypothetical protein
VKDARARQAPVDLHRHGREPQALEIEVRTDERDDEDEQQDPGEARDDDDQR